MKRHDDRTVELTEAEQVVLEWHSSLLDTGHSHAAADEQILLRTPVDGMTWKVMADQEFRKYLHGIKFWGPLAKDDHRPGEEPVPRIFFLDNEGNDKSEAEVRRLGPDVWLVTDPDCDMGHILTRQQIMEDPYLRLQTCGATLTVGSTDPSSTECDKDEGHPMPHEGDDPLGVENLRVQWTGGGYCAGDPLPTHLIGWVNKPAASEL